MNSNVRKYSLRTLYFQRNIFLSLSLILGLTVFVLSCFLFLKRERVVVAPPVIEREFWVDKNAISATYLEQFGTFLGQLLLSKSAHSASEQRTIILRHTDPSFSGVIRKRLIDEEEILKKQNTAYTFYPERVAVNLAKMEVQLTGDRVAFADSKMVSTQKETYALQFSYSGFRLLLISIEAMEKAG